MILIVLNVSVIVKVGLKTAVENIVDVEIDILDIGEKNLRVNIEFSFVYNEDTL